MIKAAIYEMEYSVSPGGIDCWEMDVFTGLGESKNYSDYKTAGDALNHLLSVYPDEEIVIDVNSLAAYNNMLERENS
jgi:hypothetical protein